MPFDNSRINHHLNLILEHYFWKAEILRNFLKPISGVDEGNWVCNLQSYPSNKVSTKVSQHLRSFY